MFLTYAKLALLAVKLEALNFFFLDVHENMKHVKQRVIVYLAFTKFLVVKVGGLLNSEYCLIDYKRFIGV